MLAGDLPSHVENLIFKALNLGRGSSGGDKAACEGESLASGGIVNTMV